MCVCETKHSDPLLIIYKCLLIIVKWETIENDISFDDILAATLPLETDTSTNDDNKLLFHVKLNVYV